MLHCIWEGTLNGESHLSILESVPCLHLAQERQVTEGANVVLYIDCD